MKGVILAGGRGTRMYPLTDSISKQLLPVYDKPTIYYPLSTLMELDIKDILIITNPENVELFKKVLDIDLGINIEVMSQTNPTGGIAEAVLLAEEFLKGSEFCLILGDNILYSQSLTQSIKKFKETKSGCLVFGVYVEHPSEFGVLELDNDKVVSIEEKPAVPKSNYAIPGIYFYDKSAVDKVKTLKPSSRGELEITDLNKLYLIEGSLEASILDNNTKWFDTGSPDGLLEASLSIKNLQDNGVEVGVIENIAYRKGWIDHNSLSKSKAYTNMKTKYSNIVRGSL